MVTYPITIEVSDELAGRLRRRTVELPRILELGLRQVEAQEQMEFDGAADVLEFLVGLPEPQDVLALRPSAHLQARVESLLAKSRDEGLNSEEAQEWEQIEYLEHLVRMAKLRARQKLDE